MESVTTFSDGMNGDLSKITPHNNFYLEALNFRPQTELGESNGSLANIKGNECKITYPVLRNIFKLKVINDGGTTNDAVTITVNGQTTGSLTITESTTGIQIYNLLKDLPNCFETTNGTPTTSTFAVNYSDDYVIIYQQPVYTDCGPVGNSTVPTITLTHTSSSKKYTLKFIDKDNTDNDLATPYINVYNNLYTIGSTFIDNDVYLFTSDEVTNAIPDNDSFTGVSAIWKLSINDITKQNTLELLYCNYLDFTIQHPIPPSAITARYESLEVQRIYWSDFYNKIRTINVGDHQLMALDPKLLSITPTTEFSQAVLNQIVSGNLPSGCYQLAYRLKQTLGAISNFSELSNMVYLISPSLSGPFQDYQGSVGNSNKGIEWKIDNIDSSYTQIETVVLYRSSRFAIPTVKSILTTNVPTNGSILVSYTDTNATSHTDLTIEEYLTLVATFTHAKTVDTKDNRLFWGNVKSVLKDLSDWDSRAFRAKTSGAQDIILTNNGVTSTYQLNNPSGSDYVGNLLETEDTINEYYNSSGNPGSNACYYQPGTSILGGKGINISYTFGTTSILADTNIYIYSDDWRILSDGKTLPWREMTTDTNNVDGLGNITINAINDSYKYPQQSSQGSNKYPYKAGLLKGYQHEEIYRFGIQFKDLEGNPFFTKWIGDIKFPSYGDTNLNPDTLAAANGVNDFKLSFTTGNLQYLQVLNIEFDVDVSKISNKISGYEIVRVERTDNNKTIWGCGLITPFIGFGDTPTANVASNNLFLPANFQSKEVLYSNPIGPVVIAGTFYNPYPDQASMESLNCLEYANVVRYKSFDCFDHITNIARPNFQNGDKLLIRGKLKSLNYRKDNAGFMKFFNNSYADVGTTKTPYASQQLYNCAKVPGCPGSYNMLGGETTYDNSEMPFYLIKFNHDSSINDNYSITDAAHIAGNEKVTFSGVILNNCGTDMNYDQVPCRANRQDSDTLGHPCYGSATTMIQMDTGFASDSVYGCIPAITCYTDADIYKLLALYFKYNTNLYGGFGYTARTNNEYISCSEYVSVIKNKLPVNLTITNFKVYGGDVYTSIWDHQKTIKNVNDSPPQYNYLDSTIVQSASFNCSTTIFFPCTSMANVEVRDGDHINKSLNTGTYSSEDSYDYYDFHSCENNTVKYFPKPLNFVNTNEWQNRVYFSKLKVNNETQDNWSVYQTNDFYDVEGNYGGINCLISLNNQMYYIQDRGIGLLMINPVAMVDAGIGADVKLGQGETIQKHQYIALDIGTEHQWSVYRSSNQFAFVDVKSKKIFMFDGQSLKPISDINGQRNFVIKRLHDEILTTDNPIISKGILTTYDYYHNEFLFTFLNNNASTSKKEFNTITFSEPLNKFTSHYSFKPNIYINNHKYLWSNVNDTNPLYTGIKNNIYLHNYGAYGQFYNLLIQPSTLKILLNESPLYTKVFDNLTWLTESIKDNLEYSDDYNVYPGAITNPSFPDNVNHQLDTFSKLRCYNDWQNTDFVNLTTIKPNNNLTRKERDFNVQVPRNKFNYDGNLPSVSSLFDPSKLTKLTFGERLRDKYIIVDLIYENLINNRFIVNLLKAQFRKSDR